MINHDEANKLIEKANQLYDRYVALNTYQFHDNSLDYFFIEKTDFSLKEDIESVRSYYQKVMTETKKMIHQLDQLHLTTNISDRFKENIQRVYAQISNIEIKKPLFSKFDVRNAINAFLKPIVASYYDYVDYFKTNIDSKNKEAVDIVAILNDYLKEVGVYSIGCAEGDEWQDLIFEPQIHVTDNITTDPSKDGCIHRLYAYAYVIDIQNQNTNEPYILHKGEVSVWKLEGE